MEVRSPSAAPQTRAGETVGSGALGGTRSGRERGDPRGDGGGCSWGRPRVKAAISPLPHPPARRKGAHKPRAHAQEGDRVSFLASPSLPGLVGAIFSPSLLSTADSSSPHMAEPSSLGRRAKQVSLFPLRLGAS